MAAFTSGRSRHPSGRLVQRVLDVTFRDLNGFHFLDAHKNRHPAHPGLRTTERAFA
jgi:hypothetical protein